MYVVGCVAMFRGHGTYVDENQLRAGVAGVVERVNRLVSVHQYKSRSVSRSSFSYCVCACWSLCTFIEAECNDIDGWSQQRHFKHRPFFVNFHVNEPLEIVELLAFWFCEVYIPSWVYIFIVKFESDLWHLH